MTQELSLGFKIMHPNLARTAEGAEFPPNSHTNLN